MSENPSGGKSPLVNIAAKITASFNCCNSDTKEQNTHIHDNTVNGDTDLQKIMKTTSNLSQDVIPSVVSEEQPDTEWY